MARLKKSGEEIPPSLTEAVHVRVSVKAPGSRRYRAGVLWDSVIPVSAHVSADQALALEADPFLLVERQNNLP